MLRRSGPALSLFRPTPCSFAIPLDKQEKKITVAEIKDKLVKLGETIRRYNPLADKQALQRALDLKYAKETVNAKGIPLAASIILIAPEDFESNPFGRHDGNTAPRMKILFVKRSKQMKFMPDLYVFPGGKVDVEDVKYLAENEMAQRQVRFHEGGSMPWAARRITALRELYEECGVILDTYGKLREKRFMHYDVHSMSRLVPFQHWVTPVQESRRFDATFFLCPVPATAPEEITLELNPDEMADAKWLTPHEAIVMHNDPQSGFKLPPPTQLMVHHLGQFPSVKSACYHYTCRHRNDLIEMPTMEPFVDVSDGNFNMHFPRHLMPEMPCGHHNYELGYPIPPVFFKHHRQEMHRLREERRLQRAERGLPQSPEDLSAIEKEKKEDELRKQMEADNSPELKVGAKMVVHVGSPLMEPTNELMEREYARVIEHRLKNPAVVRDKYILREQK